MEGKLGIRHFWICILSVLTFLFFIPNAALSIPNIEVYTSTNTLEMCPCKTSVIFGRISNLENVPQEVEIKADKSWVIVAPNTFRLDPFGSENIYVYITPTCQLEPGTYSVNLLFHSRDVGGEKTEIVKKLEVSVLACHRLEMEARPSFVRGCTGSSANITLRLRNLGIAREQVIVSSSNGYFSRNVLDIAAGEEVNTTLFLPLSLNMDELVVEASSTTSYAAAKIIIPVRAFECYSARIYSNQRSLKVCANTSSSISFALENTGIKRDTYDLRASFGKLNVSRVSLEPGETASFQLVFSSTTPGEYELDLIAESVHTQKSLRTKVLVEDCSDIALIILPHNASMCEDEESELMVAVKNTGMVREEVHLRTDRGLLEEKRAVLEPAELWTTKLKLSGSKLGQGRHKVTVWAENNKKDSQALTIRVFPFKECYSFEVLENRTYINMNETRGYAVELSVKNSGLKRQHILLNIEAPSWVLLSPADFDLEPGENKTAYIFATPPYNLTSGVYEAFVTLTNQKGVKRETVVHFVKGNASLMDLKRDGAWSGNRISGKSYAGRSNLKRMLISFVVAFAVVFLLLILPQELEKMAKKRKSKRKGVKKKKGKKGKREIEDIKKILESV